MSRPFEFNDAAKIAARVRQQGRCAHCGRVLTDLWEEAHHVVPNQSGKAGKKAHQWLKSADNCVVLCDMCHNRVHENGKFRNGAVPMPSYYEFSHGRDKKAHKGWAGDLDTRAEELWASKSR